MQAAPSQAASAHQIADSTARSWLPTRARYSMKNRLFSNNILYSRDIWARGTATWTSTCIFAGILSALAFFAHVYFIKANVSQGSSNQTKPLWQLSTMLADDATINRLDTELDSDEYQDQDQSSRSSGFLANSKERLALRRMLGRNEIKRSSIVRITSSDPTSSLCENPMQVDLEPTTKRSFWPAPVSNTPPSDSSNPNSPTTASATLSAAGPRQASGSPTPSVTRRRKESGRLLAGEGGRRQHSASPSPSRSPLSSTTGLPTRPARVRPVDTRSPLGRGARSKRNSTSSFSSPDGLNSPKPPPPASKTAVEESVWADEAGTPIDERDQAQATPSMASEASFASVAHGHTSASLEDEHAPSPSACSSPTSSTFSISRAPSILKRRPQSFRTASLRDIDISYSLMQRKASLPAFPLLADPSALQQQQQQQEFWQQANGMFLPHPFASSPAPPPYQPSMSPDMAPQSPTESPSDTPSWGRNKKRSIKLIEPDWRPHIDSHARARERLDTATRFTAFKMASDSARAIESKFDGDNVDVDDFWFERFTQSTAAAGRDWDWRKRRARLQRAAALGMALGQSGLASPPAANALPGNVGKTDVQLRHQQEGSDAAASAAQAAPPVRKTLPSAPLITFTEQELATAPVLKIDTESGRRPSPRDAQLSPTLHGNGTPLSPTPSGTGTPLGGIFGAVLPSADSVSAHMAARMAPQRRRASEDATILPPTSSISPNSTLKNGAVNRINRRRLSASAAAAGGIPSSPGPSSQANSPTAEGLSSSPFREYASSPLASTEMRRTSFDASSSSSSPPPATGMSGSFGVPGRLSSLGSVGKKVSLANLRALRRGSGSGDFLQDTTGIELVPNSPDLVADGERDQFSSSTPSPEGPRSSADVYGPPPSVPEDVPLSRTDSRLKQQSGSLRSKKQPSYKGGLGVAKQSSAPAATSYNQEEIVEELRGDWERDSNSTSKDSSKGSIDSSDSLRRRLRSQTDTAGSSRIDTLSSLPPSSSLPVSKGRARNGSRSSIMRSASGATSELSRTGRRRSSSILNSDTTSITSSVLSQTGGGSRTGSLRKGSPKQTRASAVPDPSMQPEPATRGMALRARSASLSSQNSSLASGSRKGSRSNSFRGEAGAGIGLMMTSSNPGTPNTQEDRRDPFLMTSLDAH